MREGHGLVSIWFFVGLLLLAYGVLILGAGLYELYVPPARAVVLAELHMGIWWGVVLVGLGSTYTYFYHPRRHRS
jgi:hypothetical protein